MIAPAKSSELSPDIDSLAVSAWISLQIREEGMVIPKFRTIQLRPKIFGEQTMKGKNT